MIELLRIGLGIGFNRDQYIFDLCRHLRSSVVSSAESDPSQAAPFFSEVMQPTHLLVRSDWDLAVEDTQAGRISFGELAGDRRRCGGFDAITVIEDATSETGRDPH